MTYRPTSIHLEPSSLCQAMCFHCPRYLNHNSLPSSKNVSFSEFKKYILPHYQSKQLTGLVLCGNYGDPMINPEILDITRSVIEVSDRTGVTIHTNGGVGNEETYYELAKARAYLAISLEGMTQESHERYRQNVKFSILMRNIKAAVNGFKDAGLQNAGLLNFYVIPWAHTIAELSQIVEFAKKCSATISIPYPRHIEGGTPTYSISGKLIDIITINKNTLKFPFGTFTAPFTELLEYNWGPELEITNNEYNITPTTKMSKIEKSYDYIPGTWSNVFNIHEEDVKIDCKAIKQSNVYISSNLTVYPCCHLATHVDAYINKISDFNNNSMYGTVIEQFTKLNGKEEFSLHNHSLYDIIDSPSFNSFAFSHIEGKKVLSYCETICGVCST